MASEDLDTAPLRAALVDLQGLADGFGRALTGALRSAVADGRALEDVLRSLALSLSSSALSAALAPLSRGIGDLIGAAVSGAAGAKPFEGGRLAAPSYLSVSPESEPTRAATTRGSRSGAPGPAHAVSVIFNVATRDAESFRRSEAEVTAMLARAVARGRRGT